jgi:hypothetical protein
MAHKALELRRPSSGACKRCAEAEVCTADGRFNSRSTNEPKTGYREV